MTDAPTAPRVATVTASSLTRLAVHLVRVGYFLKSCLWAWLLLLAPMGWLLSGFTFPTVAIAHTFDAGLVLVALLVALVLVVVQPDADLRGLTG